MKVLLPLLTVVAAATGYAQNDECVGAIDLFTDVPVAFDTTGATSSASNWACGSTPSTPDVWFRYVATGNDWITIEACSPTMDVVIEAFEGTCGGLVLNGCIERPCGPNNPAAGPVAPGFAFYIRVGGMGGATGAGSIVMKSTPTNCLWTAPSNNGGSVGGAVLFDLTVAADTSISSLGTHFTAAAGSSVGMMVYTTPTSYVGQELNAAAWILVATDDGMAVSGGSGNATFIDFATPLHLSVGSYGVALVAVGSAHAYANGNGANQSRMTADGVLSFNAGAAQNVPLTSTPFTPRVWTGLLCHSPVGPGTTYCSPAVPNSTGTPGRIGARGSALVASNDLTLDASDLPLSSFGYFLASRTQGLVNQPGGSLGVLCLGGAIGRYTGAGQIQNTGALGSFSLVLDLTHMPQPTGFVTVVAGETWNFQAWHRDSVGGVANSNFTDAVTIAFL